MIFDSAHADSFNAGSFHKLILFLLLYEFRTNAMHQFVYM